MTCTHHWLIEQPRGERLSRGECKLCGETREFSNSLPIDWDSLSPAAKAKVDKLRHTKRIWGARRRGVAAHSSVRSTVV